MSDVADIRANIFDIKGEEMVQRTQFHGKAHLAFRATGTQIPHEILKAPPSLAARAATESEPSQLPLQSVVTTS